MRLPCRVLGLYEFNKYNGGLPKIFKETTNRYLLWAQVRRVAKYAKIALSARVLYVGLYQLQNPVCALTALVAWATFETLYQQVNLRYQPRPSWTPSVVPQTA